MIVYLGLGSNLGQREANMNRAIQLIEERAINLLRASSLYETTPWGYTQQPPFFNCVLEVETILPPQLLLETVKVIEQEVGRKKTFRWGPRLIDIDTILYDDVIIEQPDLQIPHPRMHERAFVLIPLAELASEFIHPKLGITIAELLQKVEGKEGVRKIDLALSTRRVDLI